MPVLNVDIAETIEITSNGLHDVAKYTTADVNVPKVISPLSVTPSTSAQTITAPAGTDGYSPVSVSAVTAAIDANITAGNIKKDVQILGVTGTYEGGGGGGKTLNFTVDENGYLIPNNTTMFDFTGVKVVDRQYMFQNAYYNSNISGAISFGDVEYINSYGTCSGMFQSAHYITSVDMSNLRGVENDVCTDMFNDAWQLASIDLSMLGDIYGWGSFSGFIGGTSITELRLPSFQTLNSSEGAFSEILKDTNGVTFHLSNDIQSIVENYDGYPDFGGQNVTVLFDLPSTATRIGANGDYYYRYPKYDTATALAWCPLVTGSTTPYYTSGLSDPQVGDNIYSDAACTTVETTVASIETLE